MCSASWKDPKELRQRILTGLVRYVQSPKGKKELAAIKKDPVRKGGALIKR